MLTIMLSATRRIEQISSNIASHAFIQTRGVHHKQHKLSTTIMHTKSITNHGSEHEQHNSTSTDINYTTMNIKSNHNSHEHDQYEQKYANSPINHYQSSINQEQRVDLDLNSQLST